MGLPATRLARKPRPPASLGSVGKGVYFVSVLTIIPPWFRPLKCKRKYAVVFTTSVLRSEQGLKFEREEKREIDKES